VPRARDAFELMKYGVLSLSIGFRTRQSERKGSNRVITDAALHEISVVAMPANTSARITAVKSPREIAATRDVRAFEEFLRDSGFSRSIAKAITARGFNIAVCGQPDDANLADFLRSQTSKLQQLSKG